MNFPSIFYRINVALTALAFLGLALIVWIYNIAIDETPIPGFPLHGKEKNEVGNFRAKQRYFSAPRKLIMEGLQKVLTLYMALLLFWFFLSHKSPRHPVEHQTIDRIAVQNKGAFQIFANSGAKIVLPPSYITEVGDDNRLSFTGFVERVS